MANELTMSILAKVVNGDMKNTFQPGALTFDQDAIGGHSPVVNVTTGEEALAFGDISTKGWIAGRNLDSANYVIMGPSSNSTGAMLAAMRVEAGEPFCFRFEPTISTWKMHSNTGTVKVQFHLFED